MYIWLLVGGIVLVLGLLMWTQNTKTNKAVEGFTTVDLPTAQAQRQMLQWEGERRYNDFARLQSTNTKLATGDVEAAVQQAVPVSTGFNASLTSLLGAIGLGAQDDGSNKQGTWVEQTGVVQDKINFCESLTSVNCALLDGDPRMAECGFCHRDGINSKGKAHRGGMYISSDDQIRANEVSNAAGGAKAVYQPTVGTCAQQNFTLTTANCTIREAQLQCQSAGAATSANQCAQCYGSQPSGATGLLYVGQKPRLYNAVLWVSHPGAHSNNGVGTTVQVVSQMNGAQPPLTLGYSNKTLLDPQQIQLTNIAEGDTINITVNGAPMVWCGWLSSADGKRTVSLDIGEQSITPAIGFTIAGDKRSGTVTRATAEYDSDVWQTFQDQVPNTVLWYQRREAVPGAVTAAWYGNTVPQSANAQGVWVTDMVKTAAGQGADVTVSNDYFQGDPAPNFVKHLWVWQDSGAGPIIQEGSTFYGSQLVNQMQMVFQVPATLVDPIFSDDKADCPTGPMVFTEIGAGLMGAHSCFKADGSFNPTQYCLQELWNAAGGTQQGTGFPNTDAKVAALVVNDPSTGQPSLDATVAALNNQANIAIYGVDVNGAPADFPTYKNAAMFILGVALNNPCDGPMAQTGPHTPECLDYLWRTSTNPGADASQVDPTTLPYAACNANGLAAPLNADGSVNQGNINTANGIGAIPNIRAYYASIYNRSQDSSNFDAQAAAMRDCFNTNIVPPPETPSACPPANPDDWQCFTPEKLQQQEVFNVCPNGGYNAKVSDADAVCASVGARVATPQEVQAAQAAGADWCSCGWTTDGNAYYPMNKILPEYGHGCGVVGTNNCGSMAWAGDKACVACVGVKPPQGTPDVWNFTSAGQWNQPQAAGTGFISDTAVPAMREVGDQVQCATADNQNCYTFPSADACNAWVQDPTTNTAVNPANAVSAAGAFPTPYSNGKIVHVDNGAIYWIPAGSRNAHWFPSCLTGCNPNVNICDPGMWAEQLSSGDFAQKYIVAGNYQCGMSSVIDKYIRQRV